MFQLVRNPDPRKKPPYGSRIDPTHPLAQGLVGCWLFNEGGGKATNDLSPYTNRGVLAGSASWSSDGVALTNTYDRIEVSADQIGQLANGTIALKYRYLTTPANWFYFFIYEPTAYDLMVICSTDKTTWHVVAGGENQGNFTGPSNFFDGKTHSYVYSWNDTENYKKSYFDGRLYNTSTEEWTWDTFSGTFLIGGRSNSEGRYAGGVIITFQVYNYNLTPEEVYQLHAEPYSFILVPQYWYMVDFGAASGGSIVRIINETLNFNESVSRLSSTNKIVNETLQLDETYPKLQATNKIINETLDLNENISKRSGIIKVISETLQISELVTKIPGITKVVNETLQFSESIFRKTGITKVVNEALQIAENISKRSWTTKIVNEALNLSESVFKRGVVKKIVNETLQLSENVIRRSGLVRIINETLRISENIIRSLAVALGWREVLEADSLITLEVSKKTAITLEKAEDSTITTEISDNSPLD